MNTLNELRRYGVEIEFIGNVDRYELANIIERETGQEITVTYYSDKSNKWRLKNDGSIRNRGGYGMELVTPILHGEDDLNLLLRIINVCEQHGSINRSCGVHIHIDITDCGTRPLRKLMKFFAKYEYAINGLLSESRRGNNNNYCRDHFDNRLNLWDYFTELNKKDKSDLITRGAFSNRGKWNFQNYWQHGTVENRAHQGTLNAAKVENWLRLTQAFVEYAFEKRGTTVHRNDTTRTYETKNMLDDLRNKKLITLQTKKFYMKRYKELNNAI
jgi:hypothetical protein